MLALLVLVPTVAVMPFKDLSGGKGAVGEAIRETVTADLKNVTGLRVVERDAIDRAIAEQNLQAKKSELDAIATVRVGTLLGATLLVSGGYQRVGDGVRLTARFVDVATGEIKGSAKVDGVAGDMLALQDRVTTELLKSAGIGEPQRRRLATRTREKVALRAFELYGDAVTEEDADERARKLKLALGASPQFSYALRDLDALEKRVAGYGDVAEETRRRRDHEALARAEQTLAHAKDAAGLFSGWQQLLMQLNMQRRWHRLIREARRVVDHPIATPANQPFADPLAETALGYIADAYYDLKDDDGVLASEEELMRRFPGTRRFETSRWRVKHAIENKREAAEGPKKVAKALKEMTAAQLADPCRVAKEYADARLFADAIRYADECADTEDPKREVDALGQLVSYAHRAGDFARVRRYLKALRAIDTKQFESWRGLEQQMPPEDDR